MTKSDFLKLIAQKAYDVLYGAKLNFSTYEIVVKVPGFLNVISLSVGIFSLVIDYFSNKILSAIVLILAIISLYISKYEEEINSYQETGEKLTIIQNNLKKLYSEVKSKADNERFKDSEEMKEYNKLDSEFLLIKQKKQIVFSGWRAHVMIFGQHQIDWIDEQLKFKLWKDKIPATFKLFMWISIVVIIVIITTIIFSDSKSSEQCLMLFINNL